MNKKLKGCRVLQAENTQDAELEPNEWSIARLQILKGDLDPDHFACRTFIVKHCCLTSCSSCKSKLGELCTSDQDVVLLTPIQNRFDFGYTLQRGDIFYCIPLEALSEQSIFKRKDTDNLRILSIPLKQRNNNS